MLQIKSPKHRPRTRRGCYYWDMKIFAHSWRWPLSVPAALCLILATLGTSSATAADIVELEVEDGIGVATADYVISGIEHAQEIGAELIIINIDTPGGLVKPMRDIVQAILGSSVPVATYVTPAGARADSAGTYILLASHVAAMNPTTVIGAATPVSINAARPTRIVPILVQLYQEKKRGQVA